jgi:hypothetical protein
MGPLILQLFIIIFMIQLISCWEHLDTRSYLGLKTPYPAPRTKFERSDDLKNCRVIHINHVSRHGSRHLNNTHSITDLFNIMSEAQAQDQIKAPGLLLLKLLEKAKDIESPENLKQLTELGKKEHRGIAERMHHEFEGLFSQSSEKKPLILQNTHVKRTKDSLDAFLGRLIELDPRLFEHAHIISTQKGICDPKLRFFDMCNAYIAYKKDAYWKDLVYNNIWNKDAQINIKNIINLILKEKFINNLDLDQHINIAKNIYNLCQLDANINYAENSINFCSFFHNKAEIENFNWEEDALSYFSKGPAGQSNSISYKSACPLVRDFLNTSELAINDPQQAPIAHLRFGHAETIMPFLVLLGFYNKDSLTDMLIHPEKRSFRTAHISPMGANIQWILYACADNEKYRVSMLHNEKIISFPIPECEKSSWCSWQKVKDFLNQENRSCDQEQFENIICQGVTCTHAHDSE